MLKINSNSPPSLFYLFPLLSGTLISNNRKFEKHFKYPFYGFFFHVNRRIYDAKSTTTNSEGIEHVRFSSLKFSFEEGTKHLGILFQFWKII